MVLGDTQEFFTGGHGVASSNLAVPTNLIVFAFIFCICCIFLLSLSISLIFS